MSIHPVFVVSLLVILMIGTLCWAVWKERPLAGFRKGRFYCPGCRYDVTGSVDTRCPECGADVLDGGVAYADRPSRVPALPVFAAAAFVSLMFATLLFQLSGGEVSYLGDRLWEQILDATWQVDALPWLAVVFQSIGTALVVGVYLGVPTLSLGWVQKHNQSIERARAEATRQFVERVASNRRILAGMPRPKPTPPADPGRRRSA